MKVTVEELANHLDIDISDIIQIDSKQLFIVKDNELYSYLTKVGFKRDGMWLLTMNKYSGATTKQLTQFFQSCVKEGQPVMYSNEI